jgi:hypothetical protein
MNHTMKRSLGALALTALAASAASAQDASVGPKWRAWVGCWTSAAPGETGATAMAPPLYVCVTPSTTGADVVNVTTVAEGKVVSTQTLDASGSQKPVTEKGCSGVQRGSWSADERRIYLRAESTCEGLKSATSAILSMTADGEWLEVRGVSSYGTENVRVARYRDAGLPSTLPAEVASALSQRGAASENARIIAGSPIGTKAVIEATRAADSSVVSAWLLERDQRFSLDARTLVQLADAGLPASVTDAMVAVSNPTAFNFKRAAARSDVIETDATRARRVSAFMYDPWGWGYSGYSRYGYGYGYSRYDNGYGYGHGSPYGGGIYGGYAPPIIIVEGSGTGTQAAQRGQMVKGRGYTQRPQGASQQPSQSSGSYSGGSSSGSSSPSPSPAPSSTPSSSGSTRTAVPRP